ncbi:TetR/AcrR family transcriptional regulator [Amycolatopsis rhabdoformis]|uniref:TetR/AcrR family transcriptional regulator n=1 Tax=Amycolatopsis rhabdoformis TaxID=1448059 RepID=A0ABZ1IL26_9PSEU|nr:TetR/AcrR family transcriptional regulator [Amycolatopsis rhabdoformis]WSE35191.1 TetR/AcrR family transcriptional regulator [Amycolatopsis rhabdoformis]
MSEARSRLLATATRLFYLEGLHSVGIDRIVSEASVTRATLYRHFPGKDDLVVAYLTEADQLIRARVEAIRAAGHSPVDTVRAVAAFIADDLRTPGFRGCAFLNAAAEYPDPAHPVHRAVLAHRDWFLATVSDLFTATTEPAPIPAARHFVLLRDGAMSSGCLTDPDAVCETFLLGVEGILRYRDTVSAEEAVGLKG